MPKLCVFAGTTEGREIAEFLAEQSADVTVCVATEYGETLLPQGEGLHISARPLPREEMAELFRRERFDLVIDATHPYAKRITESIAATCAGTDTEYLRLLRPDTAAPENAVFVEDAAGAAEYLDRVDGNILLTTGSRELHAFASVRDFASRAYARVLPMEDSLRACREAGLPPAHILAMQGPFSRELNAAMLRSIGAACRSSSAVRRSARGSPPRKRWSFSAAGSAFPQSRRSPSWGSAPAAAPRSPARRAKRCPVPGVSSARRG